MTPLLARSSRRHLARHPWQAGLAILGVALGVAVVVSIELANGSAQQSFTLSTEAVTGRATHSVAADTGLPEELLTTLRRRFPAVPSAPVVDGYLTLDALPGQAFPLLGVDPFSERPFRPYWSGGGASRTGGTNPQLSAFLTQPGAILLGASTAERLGVEAGEAIAARVTGRPVTLQVAGVLQASDSTSQQALADLLIADIATAQEILGQVGRLSRIDLILPAETEGDELAARIAAELPAGVTLLPTAARQENVLAMSRAFRLNLRALSLLALVCGAFLIYNTMTFSVVQRRPAIGRMRALGVTRREILGLVLGEAAVMGSIGTVAGLVLGVVLGRGLVKLVTQTVNDFYFRVGATELSVDPALLARGALLGLSAALLAALAPAMEATGSTPGAVLRRSVLEERYRRRLPRATGLALLLLGVAIVLLTLPSRSLILSFIALAAGVLGAALLAPAATVVLSKLAAPLLAIPFGILGRMAGRGVVAALSRTSTAIATLMVTVAVTIGVGVMVSSFRVTVESWLATTLQADAYLTAAGRLTSEQAAIFGPETVDRLLALPEVEKVNTLRWLQVETDRGPTMLRALAADEATIAAFDLVEGDRRDAWRQFTQGTGVLVSEPLAYRRQMSVGDRIRLDTPAGPRELLVAGIAADYAADQGAYLISRDAFRQWWDDDRFSALALFARAGTDDEALVEKARQVAGAAGHSLSIVSTGALRAQSLDTFDRTFLITTVLRLLAGIVAFIGVLSALMSLQLERGHELGVLRANGLTPGQLWQLVLTQTGLMGLVAGLLAMPVGLAMSAVMIYIINRRSFGWSLEMQWTPSALLQALALSLAAALLAGLYPAYRMASTSPAVALREE